MIDDWLDLTVLEAGKRGPALKNRLVGDAAMHKGLLDRESLIAEDGAKYVKDTLRLHFVKGAQSIFFWRFYRFSSARRENIEMVKWIGKFALLLKRLRDAWVDMLPVSVMSQEQRETQYRTDVTQLNEERQGINATALDPNSQETRDQWYATQVARHERSFSFSDNVTTLMFIVACEKGSPERATYYPFSPRKACPCLYP